MIIAIDYDNTYTADPISFGQIISLLKDAGHTIICITNRQESDSDLVLNSIGKISGIEKCIFAGNKFKRDAAAEHGYKVNIWIDDMPEMIGPIYLF